MEWFGVGGTLSLLGGHDINMHRIITGNLYSVCSPVYILFTKSDLKSLSASQ